MEEPTPVMDQYRRVLEDSERHQQDAYDNTVLMLSGGALGISFVFLKDVIAGRPIQNPALLLAAWTCWALSAALVLAGFYVGVMSHRRAIESLEKGKAYSETPGGRWAKTASALNPTAGLLFFLGVAAMMAFVFRNLG